MKPGTPTLQSEADIAKPYYLDGIFGSIGAHGNIKDAEHQMFQLSNHAWFDAYPDYYHQGFREDTFQKTDRGTRHSSFHLMAGSAHTPNWEQLNLMAEDISSRIGYKYINFSFIDDLNVSHLGFIDAAVMPKYKDDFRNSFLLKTGDQLLTNSNQNLWEVITKSFYIIADHKDRHGALPHDLKIEDVVQMNAQSFRPAEFMFNTEILNYSAKGIEANDKAHLPDTNVKALDFAVNAVNDLARGRNIDF